MILCCGEALIDFLPRETREGATAFQPFVGGSVFNTAVALGRLRVPVGFFGGLSTDFFGDQLRDGLMASLLLGSLGTLIGGFYAAYKAGTLEMKHGALVGIGSILLGLLLTGGADSQTPEWFMALSFAAAIPAGALGGFLAEMFKGAAGGGPSSRPPGWPSSR